MKQKKYDESQHVDNRVKCEDCGRTFVLPQNYYADDIVCQSCGSKREDEFLKEEAKWEEEEQKHPWKYCERHPAIKYRDGFGECPDCFRENRK